MSALRYELPTIRDVIEAVAEQISAKFLNQYPHTVYIAEHLNGFDMTPGDVIAGSIEDILSSCEEWGCRAHSYLLEDDIEEYNEIADLFEDWLKENVGENYRQLHGVIGFKNEADAVAFRFFAGL